MVPATEGGIALRSGKQMLNANVTRGLFYGRYVTVKSGGLPPPAETKYDYNRQADPNTRDCLPFKLIKLDVGF